MSQPPYSPFPTRRQSPLPLVFAGAAFALAAYLVLDRTGVFEPPPDANPRTVTTRGELAPLEQGFVDIFAKTSPSVAHINTASLVRTSYGRTSTQNGSGSGFVWNEQGIIVTNDHVVRDARDVHVTINGRNYVADVVGSSPNHDLAILLLRGSKSGLVPITIGTSDDLRVGQAAIAIGNPFGFDQTMTTGIVSALDRTLKTEDGRLMHGLIQVDAAINPGNSGGPLLDSAGRLIGVTTAIYSPSGANAGLGFAVPVDLVNVIVPRLIAKRPTTPLLGVRSNWGSMPLSPSLNIDYSSGAIVTEIVEGLGAHEAGLRPFEITDGGQVLQYGDVIVAIDGQPVRAFSELPRILSGRASGETVRLTVIRGLPDSPTTVDLPIELRTIDDATSGNQ